MYQRISKLDQRAPRVPPDLLGALQREAGAAGDQPVPVARLRAEARPQRVGTGHRDQPGPRDGRRVPQAHGLAAGPSCRLVALFRETAADGAGEFADGKADGGLCRDSLHCILQSARQQTAAAEVAVRHEKQNHEGDRQPRVRLPAGVRDRRATAADGQRAGLSGAAYVQGRVAAAQHRVLLRRSTAGTGELTRVGQDRRGLHARQRAAVRQLRRGHDLQRQRSSRAQRNGYLCHVEPAAVGQSRDCDREQRQGLPSAGRKRGDAGSVCGHCGKRRCASGAACSSRIWSAATAHQKVDRQTIFSITFEFYVFKRCTCK